MWITNKISLLACVLSTTLLFGGSAKIYNDSPYELKAEIHTADGKSQGSITIPPQQQSQWQDFSGGNSTWSQTPYTIYLFCKNGKKFGTIKGVTQGATVTALSAIGPLSCESDNKDKNGNQSESDQTPQTEMPFNPNQEPFNPDQTPFNPSPDQQNGQGQNQQGNSGSSDPFGPADPHSAPGDPIWGPP